MSEDMQSAGNRRSFGAGALVATGLVAFAIAAVAGYAFGHGKGEDSGEDSGREAVSARYEPGAPGYQKIYDAGQQAGQEAGEKSGRAAGEKQGKKVGFEQGKQAGEKSGEATGISEGASAALGGLAGWENGVFYVVKGGAGSNGVTYAISDRHQMEPNYDYKICARNSAAICRSPTAEQ